MRTLPLILTILLTITLLFTSHAQSDLVTVSFKNKPLGEVLKELKDRYKFNFSYDQNLGILKRPISIEANNISAQEFLKSLFKKAGADYKVIDGHVAISEKKNDERSAQITTKFKSNEIAQPDKEKRDNGDIKNKELIPTKQEDLKSEEIEQAKQEPAIHIVNDNPIESTPLKPELSENEIKSENDALPTSTNDNDVTKTISSSKNISNSKSITSHRLAFGAIASIDSYRFTRPTFEGSQASFSDRPNFSFGIYGQYLLSNKWSLDMQARIARRNFDMNYNFQIIDSGDPFVLDKTTFKLLYVNIPTNVNFLLFHKGNFSLNVAMGVSFDILISDQLTTILKDGNETTTPIHFGTIRKFTFGAQGAVRAQYALSERLKVNLSPIYRQYLTDINDGVTGVDMRMMSLELGILYRL